MTHPTPILRSLVVFAKRVFASAANRAAALSLLLLIAVGVPASAADAPGTGTISGTVGNKMTGNLLEGARVALPALNRSALVDHTGHYVIEDVPAGTHELTASYVGLDPMSLTVVVTAGQRATRDFDLTSGIYTLEAFKVAGEREGNAAAQQQQRNADNLKNVVAMDAYGNLPNLNATELALRLPGISFGDPGDEVVEQIQVRGMGQGTTVITVDGALMSSFSAQNRTTRMTAFNGTMFDSLEVIKGQVPDKGADSLGGTVNFRTRSPLSMREKRRISYTANITTIPRFAETVPLFRKRPLHELLTFSYQEKFKAFGSSEDNLAVFVNAFYSENAFGYYETTRDFQQTDARPAYLWDYRTRDDYNNRMQRSINTKFDYRLAPNSMIHLNLIANDAPEPMRRQYNFRAFAGSQTTVPNATSTGVVPGWTDRITTVRAVPTAATAVPSTTPPAAIDITDTLIQRNQRLRHMDWSGEHTFGPFDVDWNATWSRTRYRTLGNEGGLVLRVGGVPVIGPHGRDNRVTPTTANPIDNIVGPQGQTGVGWILDRTESDLYPRFIQNGGLDFTNPANYRPTQNGLTSNAGDLQEHHVRDAKLNVRYRLPIASDQLQMFVKAGGELRDQSVLNTQFRRRWSYISPNPLPTDPTIELWPQVKTNWKIPNWEGAQFVEGGKPKDPSLWEEDKYFHEQTMYTGFTYIDEKVDAGYAMVQGKLGNTGFLAGVRREITISKAFAYNKIKASLASTAAQQAADPVAAAKNDYAGGFSERDGAYGKNFPSIHLYRNWTPNFKTRASWSTSFARPGMNKMLPSATVNDTARTLTVGNPALKPQWSQNWDLTAEYYYEPSGSFSVGWFHKRIRDYLVDNVDTGTILTDGNDNGFQGQYGGYEVFTSLNGGTATCEGWEFSYAQQFRFLPGLLKTLSLNANLTLINQHGTLVTASSINPTSSTTTNLFAYLKNDQIVNFVPRTGNISLSWSYKKFGTRVLYNYTSQNLRSSYNVTAPSRNQYLMPRELVNLGMTYRLKPNVTLQLDIANLFNEPQQYFRGNPDQRQMWRLQGTKFTLGVQGQL